jgi:hypothetical protein
MSKKPKILIGNRFFRLTVMERVGKDRYDNVLWRCKCDCGNETIVKSTSLTMLARPIRSCGCYRQKDPGQCLPRWLYRGYLKRDEEKKRVSDLTFDCFLEITKSNCHYCGEPPRQKLRLKYAKGEYIYNGIDRLNNDLGYTKSNSVACCKICNHMKSNRSEQDFLSHISRVLRYRLM